MDVKTAVRTLDLFEAFTGECKPLSLSDIGAGCRCESELPVPSRTTGLLTQQLSPLAQKL